jgi:hypothetical protein
VKTHEQADGGGKTLRKKSVAFTLTHRKKDTNSIIVIIV